MYRFSKYLAYKRKIKGISDDEMARILCVSVTHLQRIEMGRHLPPPETLIAFANALGLNVEELIIQHLNEYAADFCKKVGIGKTLTMSWKEDECGVFDGLDSRLKFFQNQGKSWQQSEPQVTPESTSG